MKKLILLAILSIIGCAGTPPLNIPIKEEFLKTKFQPSKNNKYAIIIKGSVYGKLNNGEFGEIKDPYINNDMDQMKRLLTHKYYDVYDLRGPFWIVDDFYNLLNEISKVSNQDTQLFIFYSGEGNKNGLQTLCEWVGPGVPGSILLTSSESIIKPTLFIETINKIKGSKAVLINACESGIFTKTCQNSSFSGIIIAACDEGCATTPYEWWEVTAITAAFLRIYEDNPDKIVNLNEINIGIAGGWWYNFMHQLTFSHPRLKLSYDPVVYYNAAFPF